MMANIALYQGTRHFEGGLDAPTGGGYCACGRSKDRGTVRCQHCHVKRVAHVREARRQMAVYLVWRERKLARDV